MRWLWMTMVLCSVVLGVGSGGQAAMPSRLRFMAPVSGTLTPEVPTRVPLSPQVIAATAHGFADLRLVDEQGDETPYVIYPHSTPPSYTFPFQILAYSHSDDSETITLERPREAGAFHEVIFRTTARDFHKRVRLQASPDLTTWTDLSTEALFDFSSRIDVRKTTASIPPTDSRYLRVLMQDVPAATAGSAALHLRYEGLDFAVRGGATQGFRIEQISGRGGGTHPSAHFYDWLTLPQPDISTEAQKNTLVRLGRVNLPVAAVRLTVDNPYYHRRVELWGAETDQDDAYQPIASGVVYKLPGMDLADNTLLTHAQRFPYVRLTILNGDNPALRLQQVELAWVRQNLYFIPAPGRSYRLYFGGEGQRTPEYEIKRLLPAEPGKLEQYPAAAVGEVQPNPHYDPRQTRRLGADVEKLLFAAVLFVLVSGMGFWVYRLLKHLQAQPPE